ncbi:MAG: RNA polymerase sigma factor [Pyrinomonadaceae bacterium]
MRVDSSLTKEQFDQLLAWLDADPGRAADKYEAIRRKLITIFLNRGCDEAEDLADDTINRVATKVPSLQDNYVGEKAHYFYGVAKNVFKEHLRRCRRRLQTPPPPTPRNELETPLECLDECLAKLEPESRELILRYYAEEKQAKIASHREMGTQLQVNAGALRARAHRIRVKLEKCVLECLARAGEGNDIGPTTIEGWESLPETGDEV